MTPSGVTRLRAMLGGTLLEKTHLLVTPLVYNTHAAAVPLLYDVPAPLTRIAVR
jgi:hypothetical protein